MTRPNFFIVGAPRCGTTLLHECLRRHPEVFMPAIKEPCFFGSDLGFCDRRPRWFVRDAAEYRRLFSGANGQKRVGEASPVYLQSKRAAREIKEYCPSASIVIMLRNPADMLYSLHGNYLVTDNETIEDFGAALAAEEDRMRGRRIPKHAWNVEGLLYRQQAKFAQQVERYFDAFGRESVLVIIYDDLREHPASVWQSTLRFLGVDPDFPAQLSVVNPNRRVRSRALQRFLRDPPRAFAWTGKRLMPRTVRDRIVAGIRRANTAVRDREPMRASLRRQLQAEFLPEVERLSALLGRDLTHWCRSRDASPVVVGCTPQSVQAL